MYVEDVNDNVPTFINTPYSVKVEELTPPGIAILNGIVAIDNDKANTPNSDVIYTIVDGNERGIFQLKSSQSASLILNKPLDYDAGDREFNLRIRAKVKEFRLFEDSPRTWSSRHIAVTHCLNSNRLQNGMSQIDYH